MLRVIERRLFLKIVLNLALAGAAFDSGAVFGQTPSQTFLKDIGQQADSAWGTYPKNTFPWDSIIQLSHKGILTTAEAGELHQMLVARNKYYEIYGRELWVWGIKFWQKYPHDARRFRWLINAVSDQPIYFSNVDEGAEDLADKIFSARIDKDARARWQAKYRKYRLEFMRSDSTSNRDKEELVYLELQKDRIINRWVDIRGNKPWDYAPWVVKEIKYAKYWYDSVYALSPDRYDNSGKIDRFGFNILGSTVDDRSSYGLDEVALSDFLKLFTHSGIFKLCEDAEYYLTLQRLYMKPFRFSDTTVAGVPIDISQFQGNVVLVDFWNIHCAGCIAAMPNLKDIYDSLRDSGFLVISICGAIPGDHLPEVKERAISIYERVEADWPLVVIDERKYDSIYRANGFRGYSQLVLLGKDGTLNMYNDLLMSPQEVREVVKRSMNNKLKS